MKVEIVTVGTEILMGDIVNTNATYLAQSLADLGITVYKHTSVGDNASRLKQVFENAFQICDTVIVTGGLGPTEDDLTRECAAAYFERDLVFDGHSWQRILMYFENKGQINVSSNNRRQAMVPIGAQVLDNHNGTAPGLIIEDVNQKRMILLPGPPSEMIPMFQQEVMPYLERNHQKIFDSCYVRFYGIGESDLANKLARLIETQTNPTLALYAKLGEVVLRITASGLDKQSAHAKVESVLSQIQAQVGEYIYLIGDHTIAASQSELGKVVSQLLKESNLTIATAESLTGGALAGALVDQPGISQVFKEGIIAYANSAKRDLLGVQETSLKQFGPVSERVAAEMAQGLLQKSQTDIALATTGIAGPTSDEWNRPVGLVYIAIAYQEQVSVKAYQFAGNRESIRHRSVLAALNDVRILLLALASNRGGKTWLL